MLAGTLWLPADALRPSIRTHGIFMLAHTGRLAHSCVCGVNELQWGHTTVWVNIRVGGGAVGRDICEDVYDGILRHSNNRDYNCIGEGKEGKASPNLIKLTSWKGPTTDNRFCSPIKAWHFHKFPLVRSLTHRTKSVII